MERVARGKRKGWKIAGSSGGNYGTKLHSCTLSTGGKRPKATGKGIQRYSVVVNDVQFEIIRVRYEEDNIS